MPVAKRRPGRDLARAASLTIPPAPNAHLVDEIPEPSPLPALDLRVAQIVEARAHPNADRLLVLRVDMGDENRQIVAGIVGHYDPSELPGMRIVVVANLRTALLRGEESQGMLLAAEDAEGRLGLLTAPDAKPGQLVAAAAMSPAAEITFATFRRHDLRADERGVSHNGQRLEGTRLVMDRGVYGPLH